MISILQQYPVNMTPDILSLILLGTHVQKEKMAPDIYV